MWLFSPKDHKLLESRICVVFIHNTYPAQCLIHNGQLINIWWNLHWASEIHKRKRSLSTHILMVKLGVGFQWSDRKKRPACSAASQRAGWVELRPRTALRQEGRFPSPRAAAASAGRSLSPYSTRGGARPVSQNQVPGAGEQSDSRGVICVKQPSLTWDSSHLSGAPSLLLAPRGTQRRAKPRPPPSRSSHASGDVRLTVSNRPGQNHRLHHVLWQWVSGLRQVTSLKASGILVI